MRAELQSSLRQRLRAAEGHRRCYQSACWHLTAGNPQQGIGIEAILSMVTAPQCIHKYTQALTHSHTHTRTHSCNPNRWTIKCAVADGPLSDMLLATQLLTFALRIALGEDTFCVFQARGCGGDGRK